MAQELLSFPFRLGSDGSAVTVLEGSGEQRREQIAVLCLTRPGERPLVPMFGVNDPSFERFDETLLQTQIEIFGPDVVIENITSKFPNDRSEDVLIEFS